MDDIDKLFVCMVETDNVEIDAPTEVMKLFVILETVIVEANIFLTLFAS